MQVGYVLPRANQLELAMWPALRLGDPARLRRILELLDERPYRGRIPDLMRAAVRGALAAADGDLDEASRHFRTAIAAGDEALNLHSATMLRASAASLLRTDHPLGRRWAREAHDVWAAAGVSTLLERFADTLIPPEPATEISAG
jgi:hypothetical protein